MANNTQLNQNTTSGDIIATEDISGTKHELVKIEFGGDGVATKVDETNPLPVTDASTQALLNAIGALLTSIDAGTASALGQALMAASVPVVIASNQSAIPITGTITIDTSLLATAAKQDVGNTSLSSIDTKLSSQATAANQATEISNLAAILAKIIAAPSTEAKQDAANTILTTISNKDFATQTTLASVLTSLQSIDTKLTNPLPISGTVTANTGLSQPLTDTQLRATPVPISGTVIANTGLTQPLTDTQLRAAPVPVSGTVIVDTSLLATSAKQDTGNTSLSSIDTKTPALGQALAAASTPVVLTAAQITTLTPPSNTGYALDASLTTLNTSVNTLLKPANTLAAVTTVGTVGAVTAITNALPAGNNNIGDVDIASIAAGTNIIGKVSIDQTTPGTTNKVNIGTDGTVAIGTALPAGTNVIGHVINDTGSTTAVTGNVTVVQPTGTNLHTVIDSGIITTITNPVTITDVATATNQTTEIGLLTSIEAGIPASLGQQTSANSMPVVFPSDQSITATVSSFSQLPTTLGQKTSAQSLSTAIASDQFDTVMDDLDAIRATTDLLGLAMDKNENTPLYVEDIAFKKDNTKALIPSDAPAPFIGSGMATSAILFIIDTQGYQSISVQSFGTFVATITFTTSNDGVTWSTVVGYSSAGAQTPVSTITATSITVIFPCVGRFIRAVTTSYTSGNAQCIAYLRQQPIPISLLSTPSVNVAQIAGQQSATVSAISSTGTTGNQITGVMAVGSNTVPGSTSVPYPVMVGGREAPSDGALGGKVRTLLTDTLGRAIVAGNPQLPTYQNINAVPTMDLSQYEGQSMIEIMTAILLELRINNQYMAEMPQNIVNGLLPSFFSTTPQYQYTPRMNEPQEFRNEQSIFIN